MADELIPITDEQARAIQEVAKTTGTALELAGKAGAYVAEVLGTVPKDLVGVLGGDWIGEVRIRNLARYKERTDELLRERAVTETVPVSPSIAVPLLRAAADESREQLQELWARLLANAMDPNLSSVRHQFISAVQQMDPPDAKTLHHLYAAKAARIPLRGEGDHANRSIEYISKQLGARQDDIEVSIRHLEALGFLTSTPQELNVWFPAANMREFMRACYPVLSPD